MSKPGDNGGNPEKEAFAALEGAVTRALESLTKATQRAAAAEQTSAELNETMQKFTGDPQEAGDVLTRLKVLEDENADLRQRLEHGREGVERLLAKVRFLENRG